ncbi:hypothetical protein QQP08_023458 [Theobroma cacao]|nr:hypothetical protein QQP08_023458 [Theobroma cacao]
MAAPEATIIIEFMIRTCGSLLLVLLLRYHLIIIFNEIPIYILRICFINKDPWSRFQIFVVDFFMAEEHGMRYNAITKMESFSLAPMENFSCKSPDFKGHMRVGTTLIWLLSLLNSVEYGTEQGPVVVVIV